MQLECSMIHYYFPSVGWIWENSRPIIEERHELERAEELKNKEDYTSLYWNGEENKSENEYEVVEENSRYFGSGLLRGIRESLLRELRRDLAKFTRPMVYRKQDNKSVNLRPGLALGVITLQAGSRQRLAMH